MLVRIIKEGLEKHIEGNSLMNNSQHGFRRGRSPQTNLIEFMNEVTKWMDDGKCFDIVYFDFGNAFDKVCHETLMTKLGAIGIKGKLYGWMKDWLKDRKQRVVKDGVESGWQEVLSSVLQGSVLGGILFNIFIDDVDEMVKALIRKSGGVRG